MRLKLLTYNTLGTPFFAPDIAKRYKKITELLNQSDIDVVCFQEIFSHYNRYWMDKGLTNFPYRIYKPFTLGLSGGLAIYSKLPIELQTYYRYTYAKNIHVPPYTLLARSGILVGKFKNIPLTLATTHLASDTVHTVTPKNRLFPLINTQADQAADMVNSLAQKGNVLIAGDFNVNSETEIYQTFLKKTKAKDLFQGDQTPSYAFDRIPYIYPAKTSKRIDFIFYKGKMKIKTEKPELMFADKVDFQNSKASYLSDHTALKITISS